MTWGRYRVCLDHSKPIVVLDFETTGLKPHKHSITEIAAIRMLPGQFNAPYYHRLIRQPRKIPKRITELTGITDELLNAEGVDPIDAITGLLSFIGVDPIVSYNAPFDLAFLNAACEGNSIVIKRKTGHSCALALARRTWKGLSNYRLATISEMLGLDQADQHRALGDARRAAQVYRIASYDYREMRLPPM